MQKFIKKDGSRILRKDKLFKKITKLTGIKITAKSLRDYFTSIVEMGDDVHRPDTVTVMKITGHTLKATHEKYLFTLEERQRKAVGVFDRIEGISTNISTGENVAEGNKGAKPCKNWWRCREAEPPLLSPLLNLLINNHF